MAAAADPAWRRDDGAALILALHVQPGAARTEVAGVHGEGVQARLKVRLAAPPVDGKANAELRRFLAAAFGVPLRHVALLHGEASRQKVVRIDAPARRPDVDW
jgi:uncharacterized protein (TIGR00251 family)